MNVVAEMLLNEPAPAAIWATLMLLSLPAMLLLGSPEAIRNPGRFLVESVSVLRRHRARVAREQAEAVHAVRYADELTVVAERGAEAARRWHELWQESTQRTETAWQVWQDAEQALARTRAASAFAMPAARTPAEFVDRERFLHRALGAAVDRGDLPADTLTDALAGGGAWNAWLHPADQERAVDQAVATHKQHLYLQAVAAEEGAWHDVRLAASGRDSLQREAVAAVGRATAVRHLVPVREPKPAAAPRLVFARAA
ncbi:hypothetical protein ACWKSP_14550 [Micromonosporaceae bacterium Da 78-11]